MQEVARGRVAGHNAAGLVVESRARRQGTKLDKESKVKNKQNLIIAALNGKEKPNVINNNNRR
jgi:hypothetical protein